MRFSKLASNKNNIDSENYTLNTGKIIDILKVLLLEMKYKIKSSKKVETLDLLIT